MSKFDQRADRQVRVSDEQLDSVTRRQDGCPICAKALEEQRPLTTRDIQEINVAHQISEIARETFAGVRRDRS
jgi:hypothetical protein